jgi:hypothetical protein
MGLIKRGTSPGELPHFGRPVSGCSNQRYDSDWTGRGGPNAYPSHSPDMTPFQLAARNI